MPSRLAGLTIVLSVLTVSWTAHATVVEEMPLERLVDEADAIVRGTVTRSGSRLVLTQGSWDVVTLTDVRVRSWLKGPGLNKALAGTRDGEITIQEAGGRWGNNVSRVDGTPKYTPGEDLLLFLEKDAGGFRTLGMVQGCFHIKQESAGEIAERNLGGVSLLQRNAGRVAFEPGGPRPAMLLENLLDFVRRRVREHERMSQ